MLWRQLQDLPARDLLVLGVANHDRAEEGEGQERGARRVVPSAPVQGSAEPVLKHGLVQRRVQAQELDLAVEVQHVGSHGGPGARPPSRRPELEARLGLRRVRGFGHVRLVQHDPVPLDLVERVVDVLLAAVRREGLVRGDDQIEVLRQLFGVPDPLLAVVHVDAQSVVAVQLGPRLVDPLADEADRAHHERGGGPVLSRLPIVHGLARAVRLDPHAQVLAG